MVLGRIDRPWDLVRGHPKYKRWQLLIQSDPLVQPTPAKSASRLEDRDLPHLANRRCLGRFPVSILLEAENFLICLNISRLETVSSRVRHVSILRHGIGGSLKWYIGVHKGTQGAPAETLKVGIREFRDKLATYVLESDTPVAITRHGDTVGYFIPARRKRSETEKAAFQEAAARWQSVLDAAGVSEGEAIQDFKRWRATRRK
jgi:PHD/YefM family antitoxin component YafN of YafNO toxin-antitoxin module